MPSRAERDIGLWCAAISRSVGHFGNRCSTALHHATPLASLVERWFLWISPTLHRLHEVIGVRTQARILRLPGRPWQPTDIYPDYLIHEPPGLRNRDFHILEILEMNTRRIAW